jgi:hypothetical protein
VQNVGGGDVAEKTVRLNIKRQDNPNAKAYWEEFDLRWRPGMNVISALMDIAMSLSNAGIPNATAGGTVRSRGHTRL